METQAEFWTTASVLKTDEAKALKGSKPLVSAQWVEDIWLSYKQHVTGSSPGLEGNIFRSSSIGRTAVKTPNVTHIPTQILVPGRLEIVYRYSEAVV